MSSTLYVGPDNQPDKYRLVRSVGRGGEATLYLAEVTLAGQTEPVVVKVLNSDVAASPEEFADQLKEFLPQPAATPQNPLRVEFHNLNSMESTVSNESYSNSGSMTNSALGKHNTVSGNAHYLAADEDDAIEYVRALLSYLPSNNLDPAPVRDVPATLEVTDEDRFLDTVIPDSPTQAYDMRQIIEHLLDDGEFLEVQPLFAPNIVIGFGRIEGHPVGVVGNQPMHLAGCLDIDASEKAARFVRTCDAFNIPILTLVDVPGFLDLLAETGYAGWVSLEDLSTERDPLATLRHNAEVLSAIGAPGWLPREEFPGVGDDRG